jgi:nitrogen fixation protein FixH
MTTKHFNWGYGLAISLGLFMLLIISLGVRMMLASEKLVEDRPYERGLLYQAEIEKQTRSKPFIPLTNVEYQPQRKLIRISLPAEVQAEQGEILLYRPSDGKQDRRYSLKLNSDKTTEIPVTGLASGRWQVKISWINQSAPYQVEKTLYLP